MKILMVGPSRDEKGGMTTVVNNYFSSKLIKEVDIYYISTYKDGNNFTKFIFSLKSFSRIIYTLILKKVDIVHIHMASRGSFYRKSLIVLLSSIFNKKIIIHLHGGGFDDFYCKCNKYIKKYINFVFNNSHQIIVLSEEWLHIVRNYGIKTPIDIVFNGVELRDNKYNVSSDYILYLGKICEDKGIYDLLKIIRDLKDEIPTIKLVIGGMGDIETLNNKIEEYGIQDHILFKGWISGDEKERLLSNAKAFILPSYFEAMPMSILESMSYSVPVISTIVGGIPTLITNDVEGYLYSPGNLEELSHYTKEIYTNPQKNIELGLNGRKKVEEKFNIHTLNTKLCTIYSNLIHESYRD